MKNVLLLLIPQSKEASRVPGLEMTLYRQLHPECLARLSMCLLQSAVQEMLPSGKYATIGVVQIVEQQPPFSLFTDL